MPQLKSREFPHGHREDRVIPTLFVCSTAALREAVVRAFPEEGSMYIVGFAVLAGWRFDKIVILGQYIDSPTLKDWMRHVRIHLGAGHYDDFHFLGGTY